MIYILFFYSEQVLVGNGITCYGNGMTSLTIFGIKHKIIIDTHFSFSTKLQNTSSLAKCHLHYFSVLLFKKFLEDYYLIWFCISHKQCNQLLFATAYCWELD